MEKLISLAVGFAMITVLSANLPKVLCQIRKAQLVLIQDSKATKWGMPMLLPIK